MEDIRYCLTCSEPLIRKVRKNGNLEQWTHFLKRRHCDPQCASKDDSRPKRCPIFDVIDHQCKVCGGDIINNGESSRKWLKRKYCSQFCHHADPDQHAKRRQLTKKRKEALDRRIAALKKKANERLAEVSKVIRHCAYCNELLTRNTYKNGMLEGIKRFEKRKYCTRFCKERHETRTRWALDDAYRETMMNHDRTNSTEAARQRMERTWLDGTSQAHVITVQRRRNPDWKPLSDADRRKIIADPRSHSAIARDFKTSRSTISDIKKGRRGRI